MDNEERLIVDYALLWKPYGGPRPEDILTTFGMSPGRFRDRLNAILHADGTPVDRPWRLRARALLRSYTEPMAPEPEMRAVEVGRKTAPVAADAMLQVSAAAAVVR